MKTFNKKVDLRSRKEMVEYLTSHFRYDTSNSWNSATSYAHNVKVYRLGLTSEQEDKLFEMMETDDFYDEINWMLEDFAVDHNYEWQVGFNGRSGGYLILYQGGRKALDYKSRCTECGQLNYKTVEETGNCKCGKCGTYARVNLVKPIMQSFTYPGRGVDMGEDFEDWDVKEIRDRVKIVQDFDELCDSVLGQVIDMIDNSVVEEEVEYIPQIKKKLVMVGGN